MGSWNNDGKCNSVNVITSLLLSDRFHSNVIVDAHSLKFQGELECRCGLGGRVYKGCENFWGRVHLFGVLLHFYSQVLQKFQREGTLLSPSPPGGYTFIPPHPPVCIYECDHIKWRLLFLMLHVKKCFEAGF